MPSPRPLHTRPPHRRRRTDGRVPAVAVLLVAAAALLGCRHAEPPVLGTVPGFTLTDRTGAAVRSTDLEGSVWIAGFIFTRCPDVCPALTTRMGELRKALDGPDPVVMVSFSVDPTHDTPEVLRDYAERAGADGAWHFLTGPRDQVASLLRDGFRVPFADDGPAEAPITHSDRLVLVDRALHIRGYYHGRDADDVTRLTSDAMALRAR